VSASLADRVRSRVRDVPDYPQAGVTFRDITPLLADGPLFGEVVRHLAEIAPPVDLIAGMEARGFLLGVPVAVALGVGFVPVRKEGKLPRAIFSGSYDLEYGSAVLEVHQDAVTAGARVLVIDDVLATGGTAAATVELLRHAGAEVVGMSFLMELLALEGRAKLDGVPVEALLAY